MSLGKRESTSASPAPDGFALAKEGEEEDAQVKMQEQNGNREQISAADYDPSLDRREDEQKRVRAIQDEPNADIEMIEEEEDDEDDVEDMFAVATTEKKVKKIRRVVVSCTIPLVAVGLMSCRSQLHQP